MQRSGSTPRRPTRLLLVACAALMIPSAWSPALACQCGISYGGLDPSTQRFLGAEIVFEGWAAGGDAASARGSNATWSTWSFDVVAPRKGDVRPRMEVRTPTQGATCGTSFTIGRVYRVYATVGADGIPTTTMCSGNVELAADPDVRWRRSAGRPENILVATAAGLIVLIRMNNRAISRARPARARPGRTPN